MNSRRYIQVIHFVFVVILFSACTDGHKEIRLGYKFSADKIYHFVYENESSTTVEENGEKTLVEDVHLKVQYTQETVELPTDSTARLVYHYSMTKKGDRVKGSGNRAKPTEWSTECLMARSGRILEFTTDNTINDNTSDYYRQLFEQTSPMYPDFPITEGYTWSHTVKVLLDDGLTDATTNYTVKALVREGGYDCALIEYKGNMIIPISKSVSHDSTIVIDGVDRVEVTGKAYFAYTEGIIIRTDEVSILNREGTQTKNGQTTKFKIDERRSYLLRLLKVEEL